MSYHELRTYQEHGYPQAPLLGCLLGREVRKAPEIRKGEMTLLFEAMIQSLTVQKNQQVI